MIDRPEFEDLIYFQEIKTQCNSVLFALEQFNKRIQEMHQPRKYDGRNTPNSEVFRALHSFLTHTSNISRLLFPIETADPIEAIRFRMEQMDLDRKDLEPFIGSRARVSEVLNRRRGLSLKMIRTLHEELHIPLEALIGSGA